MERGTSAGGAPGGFARGIHQPWLSFTLPGMERPADEPAGLSFYREMARNLPSILLSDTHEADLRHPATARRAVKLRQRAYAALL